MLTTVPQGLLEKAVRLHGHLGPFLVLGLKMGLKAESIIGKPVACEVFAILRKPYVCAADGLKTVIRGNIVLKEGKGLSAKFSNGKDSLVIEVRRSIVEKYAGVSWEKCEENAYEVMKSRDEELFEQ